jgi:hypothetical protein
MPTQGRTRANMLPGSGTILDVNSHIYDVAAALADIRTRLSQIVTNTGGEDPVNLETILQAIEVIDTAIQVAAEATAANTASIDARSEGIRNFTEATADATAACHAALVAIEASGAASTVDLAALVVINTAIQAAVQIIDNIVGTHDAVAPTGLAMMGGVAVATVPVAVADGDAVRLNVDPYGRLRSAEFDPALSAAQVSDVAPAQMQVLIETGWTALSAPAAETPVLDVRDYEDITVEYVIATIDTSVDLIVWGSLDGTTWFPMSAFTVLAADDQDDSVVFSCVKVAYIKCEFDAEVGGTNAVVTFKIMCGN